ncbi:hypothetical protein FAES_2974 [Fibrella aestuarina BUZ 2]|uniref:Uncharacterized protein n=1 Tax=Fibrella aestuarina BUZ 2 TaxID=1166018 RepID=I0KA30_9BACT|nr:hypothetical protein [Fibrella aestuarina]CCH00983.1 hypothetical protein FAES_2974 [Fibrella aestuarina BUZ 2]
MKDVIQLLHSYARFRAAVLRSLDIANLSKAEFARITGMEANSKYRRQLNPALWKPAELHQLGVGLGLIDGSSFKLAELANMISKLPDPVRKSVCRYTLLTNRKLEQRSQSPESWQPYEVDKILYFLETMAIQTN